MVINSNHERYEDLLLIRDKITCRERERERERARVGGAIGGEREPCRGQPSGEYSYRY